jgi:MoxR-like ATPase
MSLPTQIAGAVESLTALEKALKGAFIERDDAVGVLLTALVSGQNCCLLGPPGTGKSHLITALCDAMAGDSFQYLVTKYTSPEEILGNWDYQEMTTTGRMVRRTQGKLPLSKVAFLDEVFKGNSAFLNSLLTVLQERAYDDDNGRQKVDTKMVVGASNELPERGLEALWDRFTLRCWVKQIETDKGYERLMFDDAVGKVSVGVSEESINLLRQYVSDNYRFITYDVGHKFFDLKFEMEKAGLKMSGRRWVKAQQIVAGAAVLDGCLKAKPKHLNILKHTIWNTVKQMALAQGIVDEVTMGPEKESLKILGFMKQSIDPFDGYPMRLQSWEHDFYAGERPMIEAQLKDLKVQADLIQDFTFVEEGKELLRGLISRYIDQCGTVSAENLNAEMVLKAAEKDAKLFERISSYLGDGEQELLSEEVMDKMSQAQERMSAMLGLGMKMSLEGLKRK